MVDESLYLPRIPHICSLKSKVLRREKLAGFENDGGWNGIFSDGVLPSQLEGCLGRSERRKYLYLRNDDMRKNWFWLVLLASACQQAPGTTAVPEAPPPQVSYRQAVVVLSEGWDSLQATLYVLEKADSSWKVLQQHPAVVGQKGLGWGIGLSDFRQHPGPTKKEGDKKSPAGVFSFGEAFGYSPPASLPPLKWTYQQIIWETQCIEDVESAHYNQIVLETDPEKDWEQADRMARKDDLYELGMFVNHNVDPAEPGSGSCIFLHLWRSEKEGTLGCTAMARDQMVELLQWMDPAKQPVLVQVPREAYSLISGEWGLPADLAAK